MSATKRRLDWHMFGKRATQHAYNRQQILDNPGQWSSGLCLRCAGHEFRDYPPRIIPARCPECDAYMADTTGETHVVPEGRHV